MKKDKTNVHELAESYKANCDRLKEIARSLETENRDLTAAEEAERKSIERDNTILSMKMQAAAGENIQVEERTESPTAIVRDKVIEQGHQASFCFRDVTINLSDSFKNTGVIPLNVQDILAPLQEGLILDKVGLPFLTGLAGDYVWPVYEAVSASLLNEGVALTDSEIKISKLTANPQRIGVAIPVTREAINQSAGVVENIIRTVMPQAVTTLLNKILFSTSKVTTDANIAGPFVDCNTFDGTITVDDSSAFKALNQMKAKVLATGIDGTALCWIMTKANKAYLEATPKDAGSGIMICENDKVCGLPVFTTNFIGEDCIGLGDWRYQPMGLFGDITFIVDPYSKSREGAYDFTLNANYGTVTLRKEAFLKAAATTSTAVATAKA